MSSYLIDSIPETASSATITGDEAHHAMRVARVRPGDSVHLIDGAGIGYLAAVTEILHDSVICSISSRIHGMGEPSIEVTIAAGILKGDRFELLIEKVVELGVTRIVPFESANTVVRAPSANKRRRWQATSLAATKQCLRSRIPEVADPVAITDLAALVSEHDASYVAWEQESASALPANFDPGARVLLIVGPEGGLAESEVAALTESGVQPVTLGPRRLRGETAAITAVTLAMNCANEYTRRAYGSSTNARS